MLKIPSKPQCSICGGLISAGSGLFIASSQGPVPEPGFSFVHSGGVCPSKAGCVEGSGVIFGPLPTLVMIAWDGANQVPCVNGPVFLKAQGTGGAAIGDFLEMLIVILGALIAGMLIAGWVR